jgi:6-phosphogluconolactonase (cycloisomerase 2 family)
MPRYGIAAQRDSVFADIPSERRLHSLMSTRKLVQTVLFVFCLLAAACGGGSTGSPGGGSSPAAERDAVYTLSDAGNGQVQIFVFDAGANSLTLSASPAGPPGGFDIAVNTSAHFFYAADFDSGAVYGYSYDPGSGNLSALNNSPYAAIGPSSNGGPLAINPAATFLFHSNAFGTIGSYSINSNGSLSATSNPLVNDCIQPLHMLVAPSGKFLYVADHGTGDYCIYSIDSGTGALTEISGSPFMSLPNSEPWGLVFGSGGSFLYSTLSNAEKVDAFSIDGTSGSLTALAGEPYPAGGIPQGLAIGANGKYLYVGDDNGGAISIFSIDQTTGALSPNGTVSGGNPSNLTVSPSGNFLFAVGIPSQQVVVYSIAPSTGGLSMIASATMSGSSNLPAIAVVALN